jgi:hypothetical protein
VVAVAFQNVFHAENHQNDFFFKELFFRLAHQNDSKYTKKTRVPPYFQTLKRLRFMNM